MGNGRPSAVGKDEPANQEVEYYFNEDSPDVSQFHRQGASSVGYPSQSDDVTENRYGILYKDPEGNPPGDAVQSDYRLADSYGADLRPQSAVAATAAEDFEPIPHIEDSDIVDDDSMTNSAAEDELPLSDSDPAAVLFNVSVDDLSGTSDAGSNRVEVVPMSDHDVGEVNQAPETSNGGPLQPATNSHTHGHRLQQQEEDQVEEQQQQQQQKEDRQHHGTESHHPHQHHQQHVEFQQQHPPTAGAKHHHQHQPHHHRLQCWDYETHERQCLNDGQCFAIELHNGLRRTGCRQV